MTLSAPGAPDLDVATGKVEFRDVTFAYCGCLQLGEVMVLNFYHFYSFHFHLSDQVITKWF